MESSYDLPFPHPRHHPTNSELFSSRSLVNSLDQEIGNLRQKIEELQARIQHLQHKRENHASYISHLRCLPPEILCSIVQIAVEGGVRLLTLRQICGTIRYVVNGMTTVWSKVALGHFNLGEIEYCRNADQLNLALKRAGATPLDLYIARKISPKERLLLEAHPYPIQSLNISHEFRRGLVQDIHGISLRGVRRLHFTRVSYAEIGEIMDSALESAHEEMDIRIFYLEGNLATNFLKHDLFQRASRLELLLTWQDSRLRICERKQILFPAP
ncbi:hypothetical protein CPB86DRAFT_58065 [Serendipita vermifera]|nr:hypothetical protein CPB86DRAFT_58065 [Serendipita vermifera]